MDYQNKDLDDLIREGNRGRGGIRGGQRGRGGPTNARGGAQRPLKVARIKNRTGIFKQRDKTGQKPQGQSQGQLNQNRQNQKPGQNNNDSNRQRIKQKLALRRKMIQQRGGNQPSTNNSAQT
jgi:hypothetical protein